MEFPELSPNLGVAIAIASSKLVAESVETEDLRCYPAQYAIKPDDYVVVASTNAVIDNDLTVAQVLDPEQYADEFPNWQETVHRSYVLCRWHSLLDPEGDVGWLQRVQLCPIAKEHYDQLLEWTTSNTHPEDAPDWLKAYYAEFNSELSKVTPNEIPAEITCEKCQTLGMKFHAANLVQLRGKAGKLVRDGKEIYVPTDRETKVEAQAHLHCDECGHTIDLDEHEFMINP